MCNSNPELTSLIQNRATIRSRVKVGICVSSGVSDQSFKKVGFQTIIEQSVECKGPHEACMPCNPYFIISNIFYTNWYLFQFVSFYTIVLVVLNK